MTDEFWKRKSLADMSGDEWESLCDGCALCCLQKLEDEASGEIYFTDVACRLLNTDTCRCIDYGARVQLVSDCLLLSADKPKAFRWLPETCAYRRLSEGYDLPDWHPLNTGNPDSAHEAGISAKGKCQSETVSSQHTVLRTLS